MKQSKKKFKYYIYILKDGSVWYVSGLPDDPEDLESVEVSPQLSCAMLFVFSNVPTCIIAGLIARGLDARLGYVC